MLKIVTSNDTTSAHHYFFLSFAPYEKSLVNYRNFKLKDQKQQKPVEKVSKPH